MLKEKKHFENFDSLRAVAALLVLLYHFTLWLHFPKGIFYDTIQKAISFNHYGGPLAVRFFFTLSGFLITYLMFEEKERNGNFNIINFYIRRALRIWPIYFISLIIGFVVYPLLLEWQHIKFHEVSNPVFFSLFLANFDVMYHHHPINGLLGLQWSVAVEEQFYLLAPLFFLLLSKKIFPWFQLILISISYVFYLKHWNDGSSIPHYHTLCILSYLSFGSLAAWVCFFQLKRIEKVLDLINKISIFIIYTSVLLFIFFFDDIHQLFPSVNAIVLKVITTLFFIFIIIEQTYSIHSFYKIGQIKILNYLGKISYGLYIYHMTAIYLVIFLFKKDESTIWLQMFVALFLTISISAFSFKYIEKYFQEIKKKFI